MLGAYETEQSIHFPERLVYRVPAVCSIGDLRLPATITSNIHFGSDSVLDSQHQYRRGSRLRAFELVKNRAFLHDLSLADLRDIHLLFQSQQYGPLSYYSESATMPLEATDIMGIENAFVSRDVLKEKYGRIVYMKDVWEKRRPKEATSKVIRLDYRQHNTDGNIYHVSGYLTDESGFPSKYELWLNYYHSTLSLFHEYFTGTQPAGKSVSFINKREVMDPDERITEFIRNVHCVSLGEISFELAGFALQDYT